MERLKVREIIQANGKELYERLGKTRRDLQYLAGELMTGNEERVLFNSKSPNLLTIESQDIIDHGFTKNQIIFLESIESIIKQLDDMNRLDTMKYSADSVINQINLNSVGLKRRNSLLEIARIFKKYEHVCVELSNVDKQAYPGIVS